MLLYEMYYLLICYKIEQLTSAAVERFRETFYNLDIGKILVTYQLVINSNSLKNIYID